MPAPFSGQFLKSYRNQHREPDSRWEAALLNLGVSEWSAKPTLREATVEQLKIRLDNHRRLADRAVTYYKMLQGIPARIVAVTAEIKGYGGEKAVPGGDEKQQQDGDYQQQIGLLKKERKGLQQHSQSRDLRSDLGQEKNDIKIKEMEVFRNMLSGFLISKGPFTQEYCAQILSGSAANAAAAIFAPAYTNLKNLNTSHCKKMGKMFNLKPMSEHVEGFDKLPEKLQKHIKEINKSIAAMHTIHQHILMSGRRAPFEDRIKTEQKRLQRQLIAMSVYCQDHSLLLSLNPAASKVSLFLKNVLNAAHESGITGISSAKKIPSLEQDPDYQNSIAGNATGVISKYNQSTKQWEPVLMKDNKPMRATNLEVDEILAELHEALRDEGNPAANQSKYFTRKHAAGGTGRYSRAKAAFLNDYKGPPKPGQPWKVRLPPGCRERFLGMLKNRVQGRLDREQRAGVTAKAPLEETRGLEAKVLNSSSLAKQEGTIAVPPVSEKSLDSGQKSAGSGSTSTAKSRPTIVAPLVSPAPALREDSKSDDTGYGGGYDFSK